MAKGKANKPTPELGMEADEKRWRAEADLRTLTEARAIRKDKERMKAARALAKEQLSTLGEVSRDL